VTRFGSNEWWLSVAYRGYQLGHLLVVRQGERRGLRRRWYARCWCGWESKAGRIGQADTRLWNHLYDVLRAVDNSITPTIDVWPPGISPSSSLTDLYASLRSTDSG